MSRRRLKTWSHGRFTDCRSTCYGGQSIVIHRHQPKPGRQSTFDATTYEVRAYQLEGVFFLASRVVALLADEPGIGKTFQAIIGAEVAQCQRVLVLCPAVARYHWLRQFETYSPPGRQFSILWGSRNEWPSTGGVICSYDVAIKKSVSTCLCSERWDLIICDESHALNNTQSQRASLVWGKLAQRAARLWCLSGTPARNNISELWPVLNAAGLWTKGRRKFVEEFCDVVQTVYGEKILGTKKTKVDEAKRLLGPVMLRRYVKDVMSQLPPLTHSMYPVERTTVDIQQWFSKVTVGVLSKEELFRQIADETRMTDSIIKVTNGNIDEAALALAALQNSTAQSRRYTGLSKVPAIADLVNTELLEGHYQKIVLFCWHRDVIEFLKFSLRDWSPIVLFGGQLVSTKDSNINYFQTRPAVRVCIAQIAAAGVAIDLTAATEVGFVEASYVPADNAQAVMRVHRFPQKRPVRSRFFTLADSVDEQVMLILRKKTADLTRIFGGADPNPTAHHVANPFE